MLEHMDFQLENTRVKDETLDTMKHIISDIHLLDKNLQEGRLAQIEAAEIMGKMNRGIYGPVQITKWTERLVELGDKIISMNESRSKREVLELKLKHNTIIYAGI